MRIAVTIAIALGVINLGFMIWQAQADEQPARATPVYSSPAPEYRSPARNYVDDTKYYRQQGEIRELERRISQAEDRQMWDNINRSFGR